MYIEVDDEEAAGREPRHVLLVSGFLLYLWDGSRARIYGLTGHDELLL